MEWAHLNPDYTLEQRMTDYRLALGHARLPMMLVASVGDRSIGSARLIEHDMDTQLALTPWLASLYVRPEHRRHGIGSALLQRLVEETRRRGFPFVYLFTQHKEAFFARRVWEVLRREECRGAMVTVMRFMLLTRNRGVGPGQSLSSNIEEVNRERLERTPKLV